MDVIYEIKQKYSHLSSKEKEIADYILENKSNIENISITNLSKAIGASTSTITRFSKKINCESFVQMKMKLNADSVNSTRKDEDIFSAVHDYYTEVVEKSNQLLNKELILKVIEEIKTAKKIYIYGAGSSGLSGQEFMQRLLRMGFNVSSITDSHMMIINSAILKEGDLVIGISISGETKEVIDSFRVAQKNGAKTIGVTSLPNSSLASYSDKLILICASNFINKRDFINTQFSTMYLFDLISTILLEDPSLRYKMQLTIEAILK
ncbi:MurR/RpiR family transcriptional regulator [Cetobacterium sp.]|uniref:MurR/RpiR family transcriptional regulator n=1 Tax=Cetobacterium sp. TaxID=2071632 RepID=UPI003F37C076